MSDLPAVLADAVDDCFAAFAADADGPHAPGLAWGVMIDGALVHAGGSGTLRVGEDRRPTADSLFRIASMTKSFTAAAVLLLRDRGLVRLDDPIGRHVPEAGSLGDHVTIRSLLSMSGGLPTDDPWADRLEDLDDASFTALLERGVTTIREPGAAFEYSNLGYAVLGRLVANVAGDGFHAFVSDEILQPLGLDATAFQSDGLAADRIAAGHHLVDGVWEVQPELGPGAFSAIGGLSSSIRDIARWMAGFCDAFAPASAPELGHPLTRAARREMQRESTVIAPALEQLPDGSLRVVSSAYCLGLVSEETLTTRRAVSHSGGYPGFGSNMRWQPATGIGVVGFGNGRYARVSRPVAQALELLSAGRRLRHPRPGTAAVAACDAIERLLERWDDGIASDLFALNVDLDDPLPRRRAACERLAATHGPLRRDGEIEAETPLRVAWSLVGERGGRVEVAMSMTPELPPRVQALELVSVVDADPALAGAVSALIAAINDGGAVPASAPFQTATIGRTLQSAAEQLAPCTVVRYVGGDGRTTATLLASGRSGRFELAVAVDAVGAITKVDIEQRPDPPE